MQNFRKWLMSKVPDQFNFCTKYNGDPHPFRGSNNPLWMLYKWVCHPQDRCVYRVENGKQVEELCICCEQMWPVLVSAPFMFLYGVFVTMSFMKLTLFIALSLSITSPIILILQILMIVYGIGIVRISAIGVLIPWAFFVSMIFIRNW